MQRIIVGLIVFILALGLMAAGAAAQHAYGDLGKPPDYDKTIKNFREVIPNFDAWEQALPTAFDWRTSGKVTVAKDQGACGGCWAFASAGALESKILIMGRPLYNLSEQQQISCNLSQSNCTGGDATALQFWDTQGPMLETCTLYPSSGGSVPDCSTLASCSKLPYHTTGYYTVAMDTASIKTSLYNDGPAYFRFTVYSDFDSDTGNFWFTKPAGTVYTNTSGTTWEGGHAILLIGWDDNKGGPGVGAWLLKNSWGATGGPNGDGTFWMAYSGHYHDLQFGMANVHITYASPDVLHKDGAIYRSATGWQMGSPPYYAGSSYAVRLKTATDGSSIILHKDGAIWNSTTGWNLATPPYYAGTGYAKDLEIKSPPALIDEHFEGTFPPTGWSVVNTAGTPGWRLNTYWGRSNSTGGTGNCADADSDAYGLYAMDTELRTPFFSLAGLSSATLSFNTDFYVYSGSEYANVDIQTNALSGWITLAHWTTDHRTQAVSLNLTPYCGSSTVQVRFHYGGANNDWWFQVDDVKVVTGAPSTTILHKDGALWNSAAGWTMTTPPYYPGSDYARDLEYRANGSYLILHKHGAVYDSAAASWKMTTPPYYPGVDYARALQLKPGGTNYFILHKDGALWNSDTGGWVVTTPPYYPGSDYARGLEQVGSKYIILHKDGAIYDSMDGWYMGTPPYYPGTGYAVGLKAQ